MISCVTAHASSRASNRVPLAGYHEPAAPTSGSTIYAQTVWRSFPASYLTNAIERLSLPLNFCCAN